MKFSAGELEATPGIEPGYTDLQSVASPLRHVAIHRRSGAKDVNPSFCRGPGTADYHDFVYKSSQANPVPVGQGRSHRSDGAGRRGANETGSCPLSTTIGRVMEKIVLRQTRLALQAKRITRFIQVKRPRGPSFEDRHNGRARSNNVSQTGQNCGPGTFQETGWSG